MSTQIQSRGAPGRSIKDRKTCFLKESDTTELLSAAIRLQLCWSRVFILSVYSLQHTCTQTHWPLSFSHFTQSQNTHTCKCTDTHVNAHTQKELQKQANRRTFVWILQSFLLSLQSLTWHLWRCCWLSLVQHEPILIIAYYSTLISAAHIQTIKRLLLYTTQVPSF